MISKRIQAVAAFIPPAKSIADVGCDHGYLIIEAFRRHGVDYAVAIDNKEGPLASAVKNISPFPFYKQVRFSLSDGLCDLSEEVDAIILSGIGGHNALEIIRAGREKVRDARLIIQANRDLEAMRAGLAKLCLSITREEVIKEGRRFYEIIEFTPVDYVPEYTEIEYRFGPVLLKEKSPVFREKLEKELERLKNISEDAPEIGARIKEIEEILW